MVELSTPLSNLRHLRLSDLSAYDAVYLGNPHCRLYEGNLLERPRDLAEAVRVVRDQGKVAYLTTYAAPRADALDALQAALEAAAGAGAAAVEVHSVGLLRLARDRFSQLPVHLGSFANVYTDAALEVFKRYGVARFTPSHELPLDEIDTLVSATGVPAELTVHGKAPLGVSETCLLLPQEAAWGVRCPDLCQQDVFLDKDGWALKSVGTAILGGRDVCLLEHLERLLAAGHRHFRIDALSERPEYRREVGAVYREALTRAQAGDHRLEDDWWRVLRRHTARGFANGHAFARSGMDYVGRAAPDPPSVMP